MPDHKFERKYDRRRVLQDDKDRIIDFQDFSQSPPEVGIYDGEVRYFKANKEWCKFIFGWLTWMQDVAFWPDAEDTTYHAIQQIMIFEEGVDLGVFMSPEEFYQANKAAIYDAFNDLAKQIVSGRTTNINVGEDGTVTDPTDSPGGEEIPDDPDTPEDESAEARSGGAIGIRVGYNKFYVELIGYIDDGLAVATIMQRLSAVYSLNESMEAAVTEFRTDYLAPIPVIEEFADTLDSHLYCEGTNLQSIAAYIVGLSVTANEIETALLINGGFEDKQISDWYNRGADVPSTDYLAYPCVPIAAEELTFDMSTANNPTRQTSGVWKKGHRFLIEASGSYQDSDLPNLVGDGMYFHDTSTGVKTFNSLAFTGTGGVTPPLQAEVPFSPTHVYRFTVDKDPTSLDNLCTIGRDNGAMSTPNVSGTLTVKITDLGQFS